MMESLAVAEIKYETMPLDSQRTNNLKVKLVGYKPSLYVTLHNACPVAAADTLAPIRLASPHPDRRLQCKQER
jgi:hypothetical protein